MNRKILGVIIVLIIGTGTVAAATLEERISNRGGEENRCRPWKRVFLAGRAIGPSVVPLDAAEIDGETGSERPSHIHRVRALIGVHKNGKIAKGICSVDGVRYRVNAKKDDDGTWHATLKDENDHGEATLRWVEENNRFEGTLTLGGHDHRLYMWKVRPRVTAESSDEDTTE